MVKFPIKLKSNGDYFIPGIQYENMNFMFKDDASFPVGSLEHLKSYSVILTYIHKMNEDWRLGLEGEIMAASNFETGELMNEDLEYTGSVFFIKPKKDERLIIGLRYSTATSLKFPLPIINYYKKFDPKWSYILGIPKSNLCYYLTKKSTFQAFVSVDGFYANIQEKFSPSGVSPIDTKLAQNISMTSIISGLGYEFRLSKYFSFYIYGGHSLINDISLRDENKDKVYTINDTNSLYGRTGLKFSIL